MSSIRLWSPYCKQYLRLLVFAVITCCYSVDGSCQLEDISFNSSGNNNKQNSVKRVFHGEPGRAALYSLVLPGAGQFYNKSYWKIPLVWAGEGFAIYNLSKQIRSVNNFSDCRIALINNASSPQVCLGLGANGAAISSVSVAFEGVQASRSNREIAWLIFVGVHLLNVVDAFVHRHLINFDTEDDISIHVQEQSTWQSQQYTLARLRIPLNK